MELPVPTPSVAAPLGARIPIEDVHCGRRAARHEGQPPVRADSKRNLGDRNFVDSSDAQRAALIAERERIDAHLAQLSAAV